ncbi:MAG: phosphoglucosamine mutase [Ignavibacteriaceae bacterium]
MPTLMVSISGIRGIVGDGLDPQVLVKFCSAYADFIGKGKVIIGRDARISGDMVRSVVNGTLLAKGLDVIDIGICPTPTVQYTVKNLSANGGIAISASHNPNEWNALKLLNDTGQFMTPEQNIELLKILNENKENKFENWENLGTLTSYSEGLTKHVNDVLNLKYVDKDKIKKRKFKVLADCVNGAGVYVIPQLLREFGCEVIEMNCEKTGIFPRLPEPIPENLAETMKALKSSKADLGVVVDPDVDRLVLITNEGEPFSEENTITSCVKFVLSKEKGNVVVNLSTTRAVDDVAEEFDSKVYRSPVGEANVVKKMKEVDAVIGGEGSGGVIYPALHYGRDALVGIALTLQHLLEFGGSISELKKSLPAYFIAKKKIELGNANPDKIIESLKNKYKDKNVNTDDGLRIDFPDHWVHFRKSNTEPIIRSIVEAKDKEKAEELSQKYYLEVKQLL